MVLIGRGAGKQVPKDRRITLDSGTVPKTGDGGISHENSWPTHRQPFQRMQIYIDNRKTVPLGCFLPISANVGRVIAFPLQRARVLTQHAITINCQPPPKDVIKRIHNAIFSISKHRQPGFTPIPCAIEHPRDRGRESHHIPLQRGIGSKKSKHSQQLLLFHA